MYKSPIETFVDNAINTMLKKHDEDIYQAVIRYGVNVDKEELLKALNFDRQQYEKGYSDGKRDAMEEIVRCKDCTFCKVDNSVFMKDVFGNENETPNYHCLKGYGYNKPNHFCSYGKRREGE